MDTRRRNFTDTGSVTFVISVQVAVASMSGSDLTFAYRGDCAGFSSRRGILKVTHFRGAADRPNFTLHKVQHMADLWYYGCV